VPARNTALPSSNATMTAIGTAQARAASRLSRSAPEWGSTWSANAGSSVGAETDKEKTPVMENSQSTMLTHGAGFLPRDLQVLARKRCKTFRHLLAHGFVLRCGDAAAHAR
jgi:hypothetical protein